MKLAATVVTAVLAFLLGVAVAVHVRPADGDADDPIGVRLQDAAPGWEVVYNPATGVYTIEQP